jgi:hypothetical protein
MQDEPLIDGDVNQLFMGCTEVEVAEIQQYLTGWASGTYDNVVQSVLNHSERKGFNSLKYLRKAEEVPRESQNLAIDKTTQRFTEKGMSF